jgi:peptidoglycan hydrolase-like protein with peptidoglycan-binding domain
LRARSRRLSTPLRWLLSLALLTPLVAGLAGASGVARTPAAQAAPGSSAGTAVRFALAQLGKPYRWGAEGPNSFDCSGLVQTSYRAAGVHLPRVSRQQYGAGKLIRLSSLRAGDLLFYARDTSDPRTIYHVGMYLGAGRMVEAPNRRAPVRIASMWRPGLLGKATRPAAGVPGMLLVEAGERSRAVAAVQHRLAANQRCVAVDGEFGPRTRRAVIAFQRQHGLHADGVVGRVTWGTLVANGRQRSRNRC